MHLQFSLFFFWLKEKWSEKNGKYFTKNVNAFGLSKIETEQQQRKKK